MLRRTWPVFLLLGALGPGSCGAPRPAPIEVADDGAGRRVLIAARSSEFKDALVARLVEGLKARRCGTRVIDVEALGPGAAAGFDAVVIVDRVWANSLSGPAKKFLAAAPDARRILLVPTSGNGRWRPREAALDAVSCASKTSELDRVAPEILTRLDRLPEKPGEPGQQK
jgi:hypothetical protein